MDSRLTPEQTALADAAAAIGRDRAATTVAELGDTTRIASLRSAVTDAGLYALRIADGTGVAASGVEVGLIAEALSFAAAEVPFVGPTLATDLARRAGATLPENTTIALRSDLSSLATTSDVDAVVFDASGAQHALLTVGNDSGTTLAVVPVADVEFATDLTRPFGARNGAPEAVGGPIDPGSLARWRAFAQATLAADLLGSLVAAHDMTLTYAGDRQQYGRAIGSFQAVQHLMADSLVWLEGARSAVQYATWSADEDHLVEAVESALVAKIYTSIAARSVCEIAIQVHGGIGNTWECMVHVHLRRALVSAQALGSENPLLEELAQLRQGSPVGLPR